MARDRVFISLHYRNFLNSLKEKDILGFKLVEAKEAFIIAVALGIKNPLPMDSSKDGYYRLAYLKTADKALLSSVLLGTAQTDDQIDEYANFEKCLDSCEQCAESGFAILQKKINDADGDEDILGARLLKELDFLYTKVIENDI